MRALRPLLSLALAVGSIPFESRQAFANLASAPQVAVVGQVALAVTPAAVPVSGPPAANLGPTLPNSLAPAGLPAPAPVLVSQAPRALAPATPLAVTDTGGLASADGRTLRLAKAAAGDGDASVFDGSDQKPAVEPVGTKLYGVSGLAVALDPAVTLGGALPGIYIAGKYRREKTTLAPSPGLKLWELGEASMAWIAVAFLSLMAAGLLEGGLVEGLVQGVLWTFGGHGMRQFVERARGSVVGGWQASHDQKFRVGMDGRLKDVRGHKYGEDRYDRWANGATDARERMILRLAAAATGLAFALSVGAAAALAFGLSWTAATALMDVLEDRKDRSYAPDAEERAFAARFKK